MRSGVQSFVVSSVRILVDVMKIDLGTAPVPPVDMMAGDLMLACREDEEDMATT
jgi:hypothetical protein